MTDYEQQLMHQNIEEVYETFISHVAEGRGMTKEQVDEIGQGRVWSGENAKKIGLVDKFGGLKEAIKLAAEIAGLDNYRTVSLPRQLDPFQELFKTGTDNIREWFMKKELGETYRYYKYLKKASQLKGIYARMPYDLVVN
jgi:protease IV